MLSRSVNSISLRFNKVSHHENKCFYKHWSLIPYWNRKKLIIFPHYLLSTSKGRTQTYEDKIDCTCVISRLRSLYYI